MTENLVTILQAVLELHNDSQAKNYSWQIVRYIQVDMITKAI